MAFNLTEWAAQVKARLQVWVQTPHAWRDAGAQTLFGFLATMTLFPLTEAWGVAIGNGWPSRDEEVGPETWARWFKDAPVHTNPPPAWAAEPAPFVWDEARRARLRAELDALYAHLYGLAYDELTYILDTFPIVQRKDEEKYWGYRTKRMTLKNYEALRGRFGRGNLK